MRMTIFLAAMLSSLWLGVAGAEEGAAISPGETNRFDSLFREESHCRAEPELLTPLLKRQAGMGLEVEFREEKQIQLLKRPLHSTGSLVFLPDKGLYRKIATPFQQEMLITPDAIRQRTGEGKVTRIATDKQPVARVFVDTFLALFSGSWKTLTERFEVYFVADSKGWRLGLRPTETVIAKFISAIVIEGDGDQLRRLWIVETNRDLTMDEFSQPHFLGTEQIKEKLPLFRWSD